MAVTVPAERRANAEDREPVDDLMRRLVEAVEKYTTQAEADKTAKDADRVRETNAVGAVFWALFGLGWLASVQRAAVSHFVTSNWGALPVLIPLSGIVAAFADQSISIEGFQSLAGLRGGRNGCPDGSVLHGGHSRAAHARSQFLLGYVGLYYYLSAGNLMTDDEASGQAITSFVNRQPRVAIALLLLLAVVTFWYVFAPEAGAQQAPAARQYS